MDRYSKVLVCGGRNYNDKEKVSEVLNYLHEHKGMTIIICGGCSGADDLAERWANANGVHCASVKARWTKYGNAAGPVRNMVMASLMPNICIAFPGGKGTENMIGICEVNGIPVKRISNNTGK